MVSGRVGRGREVCRMCESFGARLRQRREEQQVALSAIAEQTKIKLSLLEALERDDVSRWPSGIFRRAFMRAYAHAIGLQPDAVVREFIETYPDPLEEIATIPAIDAAPEGGSVNGGPPTRFRYFVGAAVGSLSRLRSGVAQRRSSPIVPPVAPPSGASEMLDAFAPLATSQMATTGANSLAMDDAIGDAWLAEPFTDPATSTDPYEAAEPQVEAIAADDDQPAVASDPVAAAPRAAEPIVADPVAFVPEPVGSVPERAVPVREAVVSAPDLSAVAYLCTELARVDGSTDVAPLLQELARVVDAVGLIVWVWDPRAAELTPALPHGYSDEVVAQLPNVPRDARNATAAAFRSARMCVVNGTDVASDALAVPLITPRGCTGVLAIELPHGVARCESVRALATIFAAQMARVVADAQPAAAASRRLA